MNNASPVCLPGKGNKDIDLKVSFCMIHCHFMTCCMFGLFGRNISMCCSNRNSKGIDGLNVLLQWLSPKYDTEDNW